MSQPGPGARLQRIAIVLPNLRPGGVERVRLLLAGEFLAMGYEVDIVLRRAEGELLADVPAGATVHDLKARRVRQFPLAFAKYLRRRRPDTVLVAMWPLTAIATIVARTVHRQARIIVSEHNAFQQTPAIGRRERLLLRGTGRWSYGQADKVVAVAREVRDDLCDMTGLARGRVEVINNPIRQWTGTSVDPSDTALVAWWKGGTTALLGIGSLKPQKAFVTLIDSVARLPATIDYRLLILGEGAERATLEEHIRARALTHRIKLGGYRRDPFPFLAAADAFVLSSLWEGFPNVLTEALSMGTPIVSTDASSGVFEVLQDGAHGIIVPKGDIDALTRGICDVLARDWDRDALRKRAADFDPRVTSLAYLLPSDC